MQTRVDFCYSFATPHRLTVARPSSNDKTLLDCKPRQLRMAWTYDDPRRLPPLAFMTPTTTWELELTPQLDGHPFPRSTWTRLDGCLPILDNLYTEGRGTVRLEVAGTEQAAVTRITLHNQGDCAHEFALAVLKPGNFTGYNPAWVDPEAPADVLLAGWTDRADRVVILGVGAERYPVTQSTLLTMAWTLAAGETRTAWLVRPYRGYSADLAQLRATDWAAQFETARAEWQDLVDSAVRVQIPDEGVRNGYYACLGDVYIMREPVADGYIAGEPGTEAYRAANSAEAGMAGICLDQAGLHADAELGYRISLDTIEPDGDWTEPKGWGHLVWFVPGFKAWFIMEHYALSGDRAFLEAQYPRLLASSRWQERQRARTRVLVDGQRPLTYGLMPRGMGDCGVKDGDDMYGVFLPHNIWSVYADHCALQVARLLGRSEDVPELERIFDTAWHDLYRAMDEGAIVEEGYRWIPGVPGKTSGSRWAVLNALFPCALLPPDHELITGTLCYIESHLSPGGVPVNTGWMTDGMWVAITLSDVAQAHLVRGNGDAAAEYLLATLNHGTPLYTWCEERGQEPGSDKISGDRQHLYTPVAVLRTIRDSLVMERGDGLELALGVPRAWLVSGDPVGITEAPTAHGLLSYHLRFDAQHMVLAGEVRFPAGLAWARLHLRLPAGWRVLGLNPDSGAAQTPEGALRWEHPTGTIKLEIALARPAD